MTWYSPIDFSGEPAALWCPSCANEAKEGARLIGEPFHVIEVNPEDAPTYNCHGCSKDYRDIRKEVA